jgi:hypothetical protein
LRVWLVAVKGGGRIAYFRVKSKLLTFKQEVTSIHAPDRFPICQLFEVLPILTSSVEDGPSTARGLVPQPPPQKVSSLQHPQAGNSTDGPPPASFHAKLGEVPTAKWSELRYGLFGQLEDHDGQAAQA